MKNRFIPLLLICIIIILVGASCTEKIPTDDSQTAVSDTTLPQENHIHAWSEWSVERQATCTSTGVQSRSCECGEKDEFVISATGHSFGEWFITTSPKCEVQGTEERKCKDCDFAESKPIDALEHIEGDFTIINCEKHFLCINCNKSLRTEKLVLSQGLEIELGTVISIGDCSDKQIVVPSTINGENVSIIAVQAFYSESIESVVLPDTVNTIQEKAFYKCLSLKSIHLGTGIVIIGNKAFFNCSSLRSIYLPDSLEYLGEYAFAYCSELESVRINNSISELKMGTFQDCKSLKDIYFDGTHEEWNSIIKDPGWDDGTSNYTIHCIDQDISK